MKALKTLAIAATFAALSGCGCDDRPPGGTPTQATTAVRKGTQACPSGYLALAQVRKIDVFFLLDDSRSMENGRLVPSGRNRTATAQGIFGNMVGNLLNDLQVRFPGEPIDLAFGVGRYEDFGGPSREDPVARPFILNLPITRFAPGSGLDFETAFFGPGGANAPGGGALQRAAPGSGGDSPQALAQALWHVATGQGFDGDGLGGTAGSGLFGSVAAQTAATTTGDVPQASFSVDGLDTHGHPRFATPGGLKASGDLGGVGWRRGAHHYVFVASDTSSVAPFAAAAGSPPAGLIPNPVAPGATDGRPHPAVAFIAFATPGQGGQVTADAFAQSRYGTVPHVSANPLIGPEIVAPTGSAFVPDVMDALWNSLGNAGAVAPLNAGRLEIGVMSIGALGVDPAQRKPNLPGATSPDVPAILPPYGPDRTPFTWMSAVAVLTGMEVDWPRPVVAASQLLPMVYNLETVSSPTLGIRADAREDLVQRIADRGLPPLMPVAGASGGSKPALGNDFYDCTITVTELPGFPFVGRTLARAPGMTAAPGGDPALLGIRLTVPRYYVDEPPVGGPSPVEAAWISTMFENPGLDVPVTGTLRFTINCAYAGGDPLPSGVLLATAAPAAATARAHAQAASSGLSSDGTRSFAWTLTLHETGCTFVLDPVTLLSSNAGCGPCPRTPTLPAKP
jgi:hypothetical protein